MTTRPTTPPHHRRHRAGRRHAAGIVPDVGGRPAAPPRLPHERDQYVDPPASPRRTMVQAARDLAEGKVDTDLRGTVARVFAHASHRRQRQR